MGIDRIGVGKAISDSEPGAPTGGRIDRSRCSKRSKPLAFALNLPTRSTHTRAAGATLETAAPEAALGETSAGGQADAHVCHDSIDGREMMKITFWDVLSTVK